MKAKKIIDNIKNLKFKLVNTLYAYVVIVIFKKLCICNCNHSLT